MAGENMTAIPTSETPTIIQCPLIGSIQKIVVYETSSRFYLVGSNNIETRFKILKIDRTEPKELVINSDNLEYTRKEIRDLLRMIDLGNRPKNQTTKSGGKPAPGLKRIHSAFGIVGFMRFLEGYYMVLITKRRRVAEIGAHTVYKIEDTSTIYIPATANNRNVHQDEQRYLKTFQNVDLSSNFYFSYSYDLTNSLQHNMTSCHLTPTEVEGIRNDPLDEPCLTHDAAPENSEPENLDFLNPKSREVSNSESRAPSSISGRPWVATDGRSSMNPDASEAKSDSTSEAEGGDDVEDARNSTVNLLAENEEEEEEEEDDDAGWKRSGSSTDDDVDDVVEVVQADREALTKESSELKLVESQTDPKVIDVKNEDDDDDDDDDEKGKHKKSYKPTYVGVRVPPCKKFVWNEYLLKNVVDVLQYDWLLYIIHGFVGQSNINVYNKNVYLALIARRSSKFAGTRFLKRGANSEGSVANEVETEQIIFDGSLTSPEKIRFTSFVQIRGSIPLQWSQDGSVMVPKPPINLDQSDPYGAVAGRHFNRLLSRFGSPVIVLDLVKKKEKRPHESIISEEFVTTIQYLNQFLPVEHRIKYIGYDMAKISKKKNMDIFKKLDTIAEYCLHRTGFYQSKAGFYSNQLRPNGKCQDLLASPGEPGRRQTGVVRTNCIDCLDRTNTAQYAIGKCALAKQLYSLGVLDELSLDYDSDCIRMMEHMYEDQGDTLALQYGGSQLVHRIKGYRKVAPWTSSSRDIMQTLSRYYNNTFSDSDKQNAINLFLGKFVPSQGQASLWELSTDFYLHNRNAVDITARTKRSYSMWWDDQVLNSLPFAYHDESKGHGVRKIIIKTHLGDERIDLSFDHYKPYELTTFGELFVFNMASSVRDFMPKSSSNYSPFCPRLRSGRKHDQYGNKQEANPNVSGKDSTGSSASTGSEGSLSGSEGSDIDWGEDKEEVMKVLSFLNTNNNDQQTISSDKTYVGIDDDGKREEFPAKLKEAFQERYGVSIEKPSPENMDIYKRYASNATLCERELRCPRGPAETNFNPLYLKITGPLEPSPRSLNLYEDYVQKAREGPKLPSEKSMELYGAYVGTLKNGLAVDSRPFALLTSPESRCLVTGEDFRGYSGR